MKRLGRIGITEDGDEVFNVAGVGRYSLLLLRQPGIVNRGGIKRDGTLKSI
jgi:hypothetical protein